MTCLVLVKPVFVSKSENGTIAERERLEARKQALEGITKKRMDERKLETKSIVAQEIWKDEQVKKNMELREANIPDVDTDKEVNKEEHFEAWRVREAVKVNREGEELGLMLNLKDEIEKVRNMSEEERRHFEAWRVREAVRVKREGEELGLMLNLKDEIEKVRNMSEEERRQWEREILKRALARRESWKTFFKSGADDCTSASGVGLDEIYKRDSFDSTGENEMDESILLKVMQREALWLSRVDKMDPCHPSSQRGHN